MRTHYFAILALVLLVPATVSAGGATPAAGLNISKIEVYPGASRAVIKFSQALAGATDCIAPAGTENFDEYKRVALDLTTEGGRAAFSAANAAFLSGKKVYVEANGACDTASTGVAFASYLVVL